MSWRWLETETGLRRVAVVHTSEGVWCAWRGGQGFVPNASEGPAAAHAKQSEDRVSAPLTGKIVEIAIEVGQSVDADAPLVVMEAMKMEYRLYAPMAGVVVAVHVQTGDLVEKGTVLVQLEAGDADTESA